MAITVPNFFLNFRESMPPDPLKPFLFLNLLKLILSEENTLKKCKTLVPSLQEFEYASDMRYLQRTLYTRPFPGLNVCHST